MWYVTFVPVRIRVWYHCGMRDRVEVLRLCIDRAGYRRGGLMAEFILEWEIAVRKHGGSIGIEEFARWWKDSRMTAHRRLRVFRDAFPELGPHATPEAFMAPLLAYLMVEDDPDWKVVDAIPLDLAVLA
jgi:hypothetical protein